MPSPCSSHQATIGLPSTYSITRYGWPSAVVPPSNTVAMLGCCRRARICRSRRKRLSAASAAAPARITFTATVFSKASSSRTAR